MHKLVSYHDYSLGNRSAWPMRIVPGLMPEPWVWNSRNRNEFGHNNTSPFCSYTPFRIRLFCTQKPYRSRMAPVYPVLWPNWLLSRQFQTLRLHLHPGIQGYNVNLDPGPILHGPRALFSQ